MKNFILAILLAASPLLAQVQVTKGVQIGGAGAGTGTVTSVSAATANGFAPTVSNPGSTPVITINVDSTHVLPVNTGSASAYLTGVGDYSTPSFALFPGTSAIVYNTSTTASRNATFGDVLNLWTGGSCTGTNVLQANGACGPGGSSISLTTNNNNGAASLTSGTLNIPHYSGVAAPRTSGDCAEFDTNGIDLIDAGAACGSGGGGGTPGGSTGSMQYNNAGSFAGLSGTGAPYLNGSSAPTIETSAEALGVIGAGGVTNTYIANPSITVNGTTCTLGSTCAPENAPPLDIQFYGAAVSDGGTAFAAAWTRYDNNQPQTGSIAPATSAMAYFAYQATPSLPQYAELTIAEPPYWTGTSLYITFFSSVTTGNVEWEVEYACVPDGTALTSSYSPSWSSPTTVTTNVNATAYGHVTTALLSSVAAPGSGGCPSAPTVPTKITYRIFRAASDTAAANANFLGATFETSRSQ